MLRTIYTGVLFSGEKKEILKIPTGTVAIILSVITAISNSFRCGETQDTRCSYFNKIIRFRNPFAIAIIFVTRTE